MTSATTQVSLSSDFPLLSTDTTNKNALDRDLWLLFFFLSLLVVYFYFYFSPLSSSTLTFWTVRQQTAADIDSGRSSWAAEVSFSLSAPILSLTDLILSFTVSLSLSLLRSKWHCHTWTPPWPTVEQVPLGSVQFSVHSSLSCSTHRFTSSQNFFSLSLTSSSSRSNHRSSNIGLHLLSQSVSGSVDSIQLSGHD